MANSMRIGFKLTNFRETADLLRDLPPAVQANVISTALTLACKPIIAAAKAKAPSRSGALRRSITAIVRKYPRLGKVVAIIGPDTDFYAGGKRLSKKASKLGADRPSKYAHLIEFGHHVGSGSGKFGGYAKGFKRWKATAEQLLKSDKAFVLPQPFLRPAVTAGTPLAELALSTAVEKGMEREIDKLRRKMKKL